MNRFSLTRLRLLTKSYGMDKKSRTSVERASHDFPSEHNSFVMRKGNWARTVARWWKGWSVCRRIHPLTLAHAGCCCLEWLLLIHMTSDVDKEVLVSQRLCIHGKLLMASRWGKRYRSSSSALNGKWNIVIQRIISARNRGQMRHHVLLERLLEIAGHSAEMLWKPLMVVDSAVLLGLLVGNDFLRNWRDNRKGWLLWLHRGLLRRCGCKEVVGVGTADWIRR